MISVSIWRKTLVANHACAEGLALFDAIAAQQPESDPRRLRRIRIPRWTALHWIMLVQAGFGEWCAARDIVPRAKGARAREAEEFARVLEAERDTLLAELADAKAECQGAMLSAYAQYAETVRERDTARAELARLTAPAEGEPTDEALRDAFEVAYRDAASECHANAIRAIYRLGVAHERAMQQPAQDRATDEELYGLFNSTTMAFPVRAGVLAVAARVRQERCLVARAVAANVDVRVCEDNDGGFMVGVHATGCDEELARCVPASDVPATLARLLGEVTRG